MALTTTRFDSLCAPAGILPARHADRTHVASAPPRAQAFAAALPNELVAHIASYCSPRSAWHLSQVCRRFQAAVVNTPGLAAHMLYGHYHASHPPIAGRAASAALRVAGRLEATASGPSSWPLSATSCAPFVPADAAADDAWKAAVVPALGRRAETLYGFAHFSPLGAGEQFSVYRPHDSSFFRYHLLLRVRDVWCSRVVLRSGADRDSVFANGTAAIRLVDNGTRAELIAPDLDMSLGKIAPLRLPGALQRVRLSEDGLVIAGARLGRQFRNQWQIFARVGAQISACGNLLPLQEVCQVVRSAASGRIAVLGQEGGHTSRLYVSSAPPGPWVWHHVPRPPETDPLLTQVRFAPGDQGLYVCTAADAKYDALSLWLPLPPYDAWVPPPYECWLGAAASDGSKPVFEWKDGVPGSVAFVTATQRVEAALPKLGYIGRSLPPHKVAISPCGTFAVVSQRTGCSYADVASGKAARKQAHWLRPLRLVGTHIEMAPPVLMMPPIGMALAVAPQGARLAVVWRKGQMAVATEDDRFVMHPLFAAGERRFAGMMWSRDGQRLHVLSGVAAGTRSYIYGLRSMDPADGVDSEVQYLHAESDLRLLTPAESRDGRVLAAADGKGGLRLLKTANLFNGAEPPAAPL